MNIRDIYLCVARFHWSRMWPDPGDPVIQSPDSDSGHAITGLFERFVAEAVKDGADDDRIAAAFEQATQAAAEALAERLRAEETQARRQEPTVASER